MKLAEEILTGSSISQSKIKINKEMTIKEVFNLCAEAECTELQVVEGETLLGVVKLVDCIQTFERNPRADITSILNHTNTLNHFVRNSSVQESIAVENNPSLISDTEEFTHKQVKSRLHDQIEQLKQMVDWLDICLKTAYGGVVIVDEKGMVVFLNEAYSHYIKVPKHKAVGMPVEQVIENTRLPIVLKTGVPERNQLHTLQGQEMIVHRMPIWKDGEMIGAVGLLVYEGKSEIYQLLEQFEVGEQRTQVKHIQSNPKKQKRRKVRFEDIVGVSPTIAESKKIARRASKSKGTVVITGESGVGKEQFARAIHDHGITKDGPFISVNCPAIPEQLLESELFGYESGAFTGSKKEGKPGKFELANKGTIFLDEIGDMPLSTQVKILRVLQEKEVERVGGVEPIPLDFRLIAATNKNLKELVERGEFREDLYYRLHVIPLHIPPLRHRKEDIPLIISKVLPIFSNFYNTSEKTLDKDVLEVMFSYHWPGNVRELMNVLEQLYALTDGPLIYKSDMPHHLLHSKKQSDVRILTTIREQQEVIKKISEADEKGLIQNVLNEVNGNKSKAAKRLGISRATLYNKLSKMNI